MDFIVKIDLQICEVIYWCGFVGYLFGELIFVLCLDVFDEDDGVILSMVFDGLVEILYLLCLDVRIMEEIGKVEVEFVIFLGFYGIYVLVVD